MLQDPEASVDGGEFSSEEELESLAANLTAPRPPSDTEADFLDKDDIKVGK